MASVLEWFVRESDRALGSLMKQSPNLIKFGLAAENRKCTLLFTAIMFGKFFPLFCHLLIFSKATFPKNSFKNMIRVSNSLVPGPNCLHKLSADNTRR